MEGGFATTQQDLLIAGIVVLLGLVALVGSLYLTKKGSEGQNRNGAQDGLEGTVFVEENGVAVRRSARSVCMATTL